MEAGDARGRRRPHRARASPVAYAVQGSALPWGFAPPPGAQASPGARARDARGRGARRRPLRGDQRRRLLRRARPTACWPASCASRAQAGPPPEYALVGFPLASTLSPDGPVSRGVCDGRRHRPPRLDPRGAEGRGATARTPAASTRTAAGSRSPGSDARIAQLLGLHAGVPGRAGATASAPSWTQNAAQREGRVLPAVRGAGPDRARAGRGVRVLSGGGPWNGLTYPGDRPRLVAMLEEQVARGRVPARPLGVSAAAAITRDAGPGACSTASRPTARSRPRAARRRTDQRLVARLPPRAGRARALPAAAHQPPRLPPSRRR